MGLRTKIGREDVTVVDSDRPNLYVLLDLAPEVSVAKLRWVYEQHVADAARSRDHRRLLRLSQGFDALPPSVRDAMYPRTSTASTSGPTSWRDTRVPILPTAGAVPSGSTPRSFTRRRTAQDSTRLPCAATGRTRPLTTRSVVAGLVLVLLYGGVQFARLTHVFGTHNDVAPQPVALVAPSTLPITPVADRTDRSAYFDARVVLDGVTMCRRQSGALPRSVWHRSGRVRMHCGAGIMTTHLGTSNRLTYRRISRSQFTITVASPDETVVYTSWDRRFRRAR